MYRNYTKTKKTKKKNHNVGKVLSDKAAKTNGDKAFGRSGNKNKFRSGFCSIIGMPNVGKSTLLNSIAGQKIAIISDKPQTTRNRILAIYSTEDTQIVFTDTPGIHKPHNKLGEYMVKTAKESMLGTDVLLFVVDASRKVRDTERELAKSLGKLDIPCVLVLNKIDLVKKEALLPMMADYASMNDFDAIIPVSAKSADGVDRLLSCLDEYLTEGPMFYDKDTVTDQTEKMIAAEMIREKILWLLDKEIPHGIAVEVVSMREKRGLTTVNATIYCEKKSHKGIIIGKNGEMLKQIGALARKDIQNMLGKKVYLQLWVKIKTDWRNSDFLIKNFGYKDSDSI